MNTDCVTLSICLPAIVSIIFWVFGFWFFLRRNTQPIKYRSPMLVVFSTLGNWLNVAFTVAIMSVVSKCATEDNHEKMIYFLNAINRIQLIICEPLFLFPYLLRAIRTHRIFSVSDNFIASDPSDPRIEDMMIKSDKKYKEAFYIVILIILMIPFLILGLCCVSKEVNETLPVAFYDPEFSAGNADEEQFIISSIIGMIVNFIEINFLIFAIFYLRKAVKEFNLGIELKLTCLIWIVFGFLTQFFRIFNQQTAGLPYALSLSSNVCCLLISVIIPIIESYFTEILPYGETRECAESIESTLSSKTSIYYFTKYVGYYFPECLNYLSFYMEIKMYEDMAKRTPGSVRNYEPLHNKAVFIRETYLKKDSEFFIPLPETTLFEIERRFVNLKAYLEDDNLFDVAFEHVLKELRRYFQEFKKSMCYSKLLKELHRQEIYYERLRKAAMN